MIQKRFHSKIASFLLGCMLVVALPFHNFLHQHEHWDKQNIQTHHNYSQSLLLKAEKVTHIHDCIACSISQLAHTAFVKTTDIPLVLLAMQRSIFQESSSQISQFKVTTDGRAPPVFFL